MNDADKWNMRVSRLFGAVLALTGILGFLLPPEKSLMSGAPAYNVFHLIAGAVGIWAARKACRAAAFNLGFGLIDLYQALASFLGWFPLSYFRWTRADDVLHVLLGPLLAALGARGLRSYLESSR